MKIYFLIIIFVLCCVISTNKTYANVSGIDLNGQVDTTSVASASSFPLDRVSTQSGALTPTPTETVTQSDSIVSSTSALAPATVLLTETPVPIKPQRISQLSNSIKQFFVDQPIISPFGSIIFNSPNLYFSKNQLKLETVILLIVSIIYFLVGFALLDKNTLLKTKSTNGKLVFHHYKFLNFPIIKQLI